MVILNRGPSEAIIIELPTGEIIKVAVLSVKPNKVRIGADAPADIKIVKEELLDSAQIERWIRKKASD